MTDANGSLPIAGWYPDPENDKGDRWWNGASWSDHRRSREAAPAWAPVPTHAAPSAPVAPAIPTPPGVPAAPGTAAPLVGQAYQAAQPYASQTPAPAYPTPAPYGAPAYGTPASPYTQPYSPGYVQPYAPYAAPNTGVKNVPALVGFIISAGGFVIGLAFIAGFAGGIVSIIGFQKSRLLAAQGVTTGNGRGLAIAGIIIGFVTGIGTIVFWASIFALGSN